MKPKPSSEARPAPGAREEEMILHFYDENSATERADFERALAEDAELRGRYERLRRELEALPALASAEPDSELAGRVWNRIRPELRPHRSPESLIDRLRAALSMRPAFALAAAATLALAAGFLLGRGGRIDPPANDAATVAALSPEARERLLLASVSDHLGGSERLLASIANSPSGDVATLAEQRRWAASLAASNRLYRSAAERAGQRRIVALLDELEPLLLELAHAPTDSPDELPAAQRRIEENDLLFKLRVAGERIDRNARPTQRTRSTTTTS